VHLVTPGHFRSLDEDGGHTIRSAVAQNLMLRANCVFVCFIEPESLPIEVLHCGNRYQIIFVPVSLTLDRRPSYANFTRSPWRYTE